MKSTIVSSLLFAGLALAKPVANEKRAVATNVVIETVWTTTTLYVDAPSKAAFFEKPSAVPSVAAVASAAPAAPSVAAVVPEVPAAPVVAAAAAPAAGGGGPSGTGEATWYEVGGAPGSCGTQASNADNVVALAIPVMKNPANPNKNPLCGLPITITYNGATHVGRVYDTCEGCAAGNIDLSPTFFKTVFPNGDGRVPGVSWVVG